MRIVAKLVQLDGSIVADGGVGEANAGGGSGGGIRIDVGTLQGTGTIIANGGNGGGRASGAVPSGGGGGRVAIFFQDATGFDLSNASATGGGPDGQDGTVHLEQTLAILIPMDEEVPIRKADARDAISGDQDNRLASLDHLPIGIGHSSTSAGRSRIPMDDSQTHLLDLKTLVAKLQSRISKTDHPQRRMFSSTSVLSTQSSLLASYTNQVSDLSSPEDFDPIYAYDLNGNRISMIDPTGLTTYNYDELNRLTSITNNEGLTTTFTYDALGRRTSMTHDNGVVTTYDYDPASQLLSLVHQLGATTINSFTYTYDKVGNRKTKADNNGTANYTYDTLNRLVQATNPLPMNPLESLTYDEVGNRVDSNQNGLSTINVANQLEEDASFTYTYDSNGNLIQKTNTGLMSTLYEYDAENKLIRVASMEKTVNYKYDGLGRRIEKEVTETAVTSIRQYIYDKEDILLELDASNNIVARYTHGLGFDEPLIMEKAGASFFYHAEGLGSITELTGTAGTLAQSYTYSSFGKIESTLDSNFVQPYTFTAREFDSETGLYHYRARAYDPSIGRFLQEDPIGFASGTLNLYVYVFNNPVNLKDPSGLASILPSCNPPAADGPCRDSSNAPALPDFLLCFLNRYGTVGISFNVGAGLGFSGSISISSRGISGSVGAGVGIGAGVAVTGGLSAGQSSGVNVTGSASGGAGPGGAASATVSQGGNSASAGVGLGLGFGATFTAGVSGQIVEFQ